MPVRPLLRLAPLPERSRNPRPGVRREPGAAGQPAPHAFAVTGYVIYVRGVAVREYFNAPAGFVEVRP